MAAKFSGNLGSGDGPVNDFLNSSCQSHFGLQNDECM